MLLLSKVTVCGFFWWQSMWLCCPFLSSQLQRLQISKPTTSSSQNPGLKPSNDVPAAVSKRHPMSIPRDCSPWKSWVSEPLEMPSLQPELLKNMDWFSKTAAPNLSKHRLIASLKKWPNLLQHGLNSIEKVRIDSPLNCNPKPSQTRANRLSKKLTQPLFPQAVLLSKDFLLLSFFQNKIRILP